MHNKCQQKIILTTAFASQFHKFPVFFWHVNKFDTSIFKHDLQSAIYKGMYSHFNHIAHPNCKNSTKGVLTECFLECLSNLSIIPKRLEDCRQHISELLHRIWIHEISKQAKDLTTKRKMFWRYLSFLGLVNLTTSPMQLRKHLGCLMTPELPKISNIVARKIKQDKYSKFRTYFPLEPMI